MDDQELIELRKLKQAAQDAFMEAQRIFLDAQHAYLDASHAIEKSNELGALSVSASNAAVQYLAALETLRNVQLQTAASAERDAEEAQLEKLREALENQMETFRQMLSKHSAEDRLNAGKGSV